MVSSLSCKDHKLQILKNSAVADSNHLRSLVGAACSLVASSLGALYYVRIGTFPPATTQPAPLQSVKPPDSPSSSRV